MSIQSNKVFERGIQVSKKAIRFIELICCDIRSLGKCILQDVPCESCPYNDHIDDEDYPCFEEAYDDLRELLEGKK